MSEEDRRRFAAIGGYRQFDKNYPELLRKPDTGTMVTQGEIMTQYVVTAYKKNRQIEEAGIHIFGPFGSEEEAQRFFTKVIEHPDWDAEEVPTLNKPEVFGTGEERL